MEKLIKELESHLHEYSSIISRKLGEKISIDILTPRQARGEYLNDPHRNEIIKRLTELESVKTRVVIILPKEGGE